MSPEPTDSTTMIYNTTASSSESTPPHATEGAGESSGDVGGAVAGVVVSLLLIIGAIVGIITVIWLLRRYSCTHHNKCFNLCVHCVGKSQTSLHQLQVISKFCPNIAPCQTLETYLWTTSPVSQHYVGMFETRPLISHCPQLVRACQTQSCVLRQRQRESNHTPHLRMETLPHLMVLCNSQRHKRLNQLQRKKEVLRQRLRKRRQGMKERLAQLPSLRSGNLLKLCLCQ